METTLTLNTRDTGMSLDDRGGSSIVYPITLAGMAVMMGLPGMASEPVHFDTGLYSRGWLSAFERASVTTTISESNEVMELAGFAELILAKQKDIPADFQQVIDEDFLSMI